MARKKASKKVVITRDTLIILLVIVLVVAIVLCSLYYADRELFYKILPMFDPNKGDISGGDTPTGGNIPSTEILGDKLEVHFLDVGQGDSIFIRFPDGKNMMIDAGGSYDDKLHPSYNADLRSKKSVSKKIIDYLNSYNVKTIDAFILTHSDADHCDFMDDVIEQYDVKNIYVPDYTYKEIPKGEPDILGNIPTIAYRDAMTAANAETYVDENGETKKANVIANVGDVVNMTSEKYLVKSYCRDKEYYKTVKYGDAKRLNAVSPMTFLEYGGRKVLFTGDAEGDGTKNDTEQWFMNKNISVDIDVLKVGHHGSADSTCKEFLEYVDPEYAVISCGNLNKHGHPRQENLDKLSAYRDVNPSENDYNGIIRTFRTDKDGDIVLTIGENGGINLKAQNDEKTKEVAPTMLGAMNREYIYFNKVSYDMVA